jgi:hypothetical protein
MCSSIRATRHTSDQPGLSALDLALSNHQFPIAHLLISREPQEGGCGTNHLYLAIIEGDADAVEFLLDVPLDQAREILSCPPASLSSVSSSSTSSSSSLGFLNAALTCRVTDEIRCRIITTLRRACFNVDVASVPTDAILSDSVRTLISQPVSAFVASQSRRVFEAVYSGSFNVLQQWLACGVDVGSCVTADGSTLLHACVSRDAHALLDLVLSTCSGSSSVVNTTSSSGLTALHLASQLNRFTCAKLLLSHSADVNATTGESYDSNTPLIIAAAHCSQDVLNVLLSAGANIFAVNRLGLTVLHVAAAAGNTFALRSIISSIASLAIQPNPIQSFVNSTSFYGDSPLHLCALSSGIPTLRAFKCSLILLQVHVILATCAFEYYVCTQYLTFIRLVRLRKFSILTANLQQN